MADCRQTIHELVARARVAQKQVEDYSQERIDDVCRGIAWQTYKDDNIAVCAETACEETGMGNVQDKITKHKVKVLGGLRESLGGTSVGLIEDDREAGIRKYAKPVGVVGALTPVTNPTATPASNALAILKGRNAVIFGPHPRAKESARVVCHFMRQGLRQVGAPEDLIQHIAKPSLDLSQELMRQVDLVLATGGQGVVRAAYSSGTPAYGVGAGNPVVIIAEDADVDDAVRKIFASKTFDYATSCSSENSVVVHNDVWGRTVDAFGSHGAYMCNAEEKATLEKWLWVPNKRGKVALNPKVVAVSAERIAAGAGISVPQGTTMLMVACKKGTSPNRWMGEKLSPVMALWPYNTFAEAVDTVRTLTEYAGQGHSCGIHTFNGGYVETLAVSLKTSRLMVRQAMAPANGGNFFNGMPSTTSLGCGTWGGNSTTENIHWKHFINVTWVSEPFEPVKPADEEMWGRFWKTYGK
ncbi:MAG: aldehyde dehydrogenase family protein [Candidatus Pacebacteria bacterium]|nr:aldehyde dehydrogenase family protein [Candidatus Paceibacterota bacterium]